MGRPSAGRSIVEMDRQTWSLPAARGAWLVARRAAATAIAVGGFALGLSVWLTLGVLTGNPRAGLLTLIGIMMGSMWLAHRLWSASPREMTSVELSVPERGRLSVDGVAVAIRSCRYDGAEKLLWARGWLGAPRACVRAEPELACEVVDALGRPERGLRTFAASPPLLRIPLVGWVLAVTLGFAILFGLVVLIAGPPRVGVPVAAITVPLGVLLLRPARIRLGPDALEWSWWGLRRATPLASIERVVATREALCVHTHEGRKRVLRVRTMGSGAMGTGTVEQAATERLASYAAFIERTAAGARQPSSARGATG